MNKSCFLYDASEILCHRRNSVEVTEPRLLRLNLYFKMCVLNSMAQLMEISNRPVAESGLNQLYFDNAIISLRTVHVQKFVFCSRATQSLVIPLCV